MTSKNKNYTNLKAFLIIFIIVLSLLFFKNRTKTLGVSTNSGTASLYFDYPKLSFTGEKEINLVLNTSTPLAYLNAEYIFDKTLLKLTKEVKITSTTLKRIVKVSTMSEANQTGKVVFTLAVDPKDINIIPNGVINFAKLYVSPKTTDKNVVTKLSISSSNLELISSSTTPFKTTANIIELTLNYTNPTATISVSPTSTTAPTTSPTVLPTGVVTTSKITLNPIADARVQSNHPSSNYGKDSYVSADSEAVEKGYFTFSLKNLPTTPIKSAKLRVRVVNDARSSSKQTFKLVPDTNWSESAITYSNRPSSTDTLATINGGQKNTWIEISLTEAVKKQAGKLFSFSFESDHPDGLDLATKESNTKPELVIEY